MRKVRKPIPKTQEELSQDTIQPYTGTGKAPSNSFPKKRADQKTVKNDNVKNFSLGLRDIDEAIFYYFNNVIKPSVIQNNTIKNVPIIYGSPERWSAVQKDGFYRDKNGMIQAPLIMFKRESIEKNRSLGNKLDANLPINYGIFQKKFSRKNVYDQFSILTNREPVKEYYGVVVPDYVNITYSCIIFTDYVEQMNKIVESINYASDAYWGDRERFTFRAMIDSFTNTTTLNQGEDRKVKTEFQIKLLGHIVPDSINAQLNGMNKFYSKSAINFNIETAQNLQTLEQKADTPENEAAMRFFDTSLLRTGGGGTGTTGPDPLTEEQIVYLSRNNSYIADTIEPLKATFLGKRFIPPVQGIVTVQSFFDIYVNGVLIPLNVRTVQESGLNLEVVFDGNLLNYTLSGTDQVVVIGKVEES